MSRADSGPSVLLLILRALFFAEVRSRLSRHLHQQELTPFDEFIRVGKSVGVGAVNRVMCLYIEHEIAIAEWIKAFFHQVLSVEHL